MATCCCSADRGCASHVSMDQDGMEVARAHLLLDALFLSGDVPSGEILRRTPLQSISEWLGLDPSNHFGEEALRHLVAIQLAPRAAIAYERTNPRPRWKLINEYL